MKPQLPERGILRDPLRRQAKTKIPLILSLRPTLREVRVSAELVMDPVGAIMHALSLMKGEN